MMDLSVAVSAALAFLPLRAWATVTKLPDAKPLQLVGCYSVGQKSLVKQFGNFHPFRPLLHYHNNFVAIKTTVSVTIYTL